MPAFVALLRGVNVGKANRVPMAHLRELLAALGYTSVATLLNSGNAVFVADDAPSARHASAIAAAIADQLGVDVPVIVKSARELSAIVAANPIRAEPSAHSRLIVAFVQERKSLAPLAAIEPLVRPPEQFALGKEAAYLLCARGIAQSKAWQALPAKAGALVTTRNLATVLKLHGMVKALDA